MPDEIDKKLSENMLSVEKEQPVACVQNLFTEGEQVLMLAGPRSWMIEVYVKAASEKAGVPIDWHFAGGRAVVLALPKDKEKAIAALGDLMPTFQAAALQAVARGDANAYEVQILDWGGVRPPKPEDFPEGAIGYDPALRAFFMKE